MSLGERLEAAETNRQGAPAAALPEVPPEGAHIA